MRILVTGATGFLGSRTALLLKEAGWSVTGGGRDPQAGARLEAQGVPFLPLDLRDGAAIDRACSGMDAVVHCAALSSPWGRYRDFYATNVEGTARIAESCLRGGAGRLVFVSSPSVYFDYRDRLLTRESDPPARRPANAYAATKLEAERVVAACSERGLAAVILRPRALFGPGDPALFPRLMRVGSGRGIPLMKGGAALIDLTYVDDAARAIIQACTAPGAPGQTLNLSGGEPRTLLAIMTRLSELLELPLRTRPVARPAALAAGSLLEMAYRILPLPGGEPPFTRYSVAQLAYSQTLDLTEARRVLGYAPQVGVDEGLRRFAQWWRSSR
ncbi:NAD(P)-dependent oxidoreductase [Paenibacillus sp. IB182496]|uniref:NAD(P)-dependent oxidoreductase n=1 Tax=Paenibacillus sabuli TaxID=2772509 RepID=A0A927GUE1_9BACL|nr:NAD(P)-dependent oxidoreductase [Paenibacillus sabuli]MBD2847607.1 NAD(P)-dependent oxidoreductase [Paenibacillus sabuli]